MSWIRRIDLIEPYTCAPLILEPYSHFPCFIDEEMEDLCFPLGFASPSPLDLYETVTDLVQIRRKVVKKPELPLKYLCHRVSELESKFERLVKDSDCDRKYKLTKEIKGSGERKYTWEAEIEGPVSRKYTVEAEEGKYKWTTEIKGGKMEVASMKNKKKVVKDVEVEKKKKSYDWTTEMKSERENGEVSHTYVIKAKARGEKKEEKEKEKKCKSKKKEKARVVVIEEDEEEEEEEEEKPEERRAIVLQKVLRHLCRFYY